MPHRALVQVACLLGLACGGSSALAQGAWVAKTPMSTARAQAAAATANGVVHVIGGEQGGCSYLPTHEAYDPGTNSWTTKAPLPFGPDGPAAGVIDGRIHVTGGLTGCGSAFGDHAAYDPSTNAWATKAPMPTRRGRLAAAVVNGVLYAVGGHTGSSVVGANEAYDPATNAWTTKAPMPTARYWHGAAAVNGLLYVIGGYSAATDSAVAAVEAYDPATNTWSTKAPMPTPRVAVSVVVLDGIIYVVGGGYTIQPSMMVQAYDPATNSWSSMPSLSAGRQGAALAAANGILVVAGGYGETYPFYLSSVEAFTPPPRHSLTVSRAGPGAGTVTSSPAGISCGSTCTASFGAGASVTLTATAAAGSLFAGWSGGGCSGTGSCTVTMTGATTVTASFTAAPLAADATSIDFGTRSMKSTAARILTLRNNNGSSVSVTSVAASPPFAVSGNCATIAAGASCPITVTFTPNLQEPIAGTLEVQSSTGPLTIALAGAGERSLVAHYYGAVLRRPPDPGGKGYWDGQATRMERLGASINEAWYAMAGSFFWSPEYLALGRDNGGFVTDLYNTFFGRAPDGAGFAYWTGQLAAGMPREVMLAAFLFSQEFKAHASSLFGPRVVRPEVDTVMDFYRGVLGRLPDDGGFNYWLGRFRQAQCSGAAAVYAEVEAISSAFLDSGEYAGRGRTAEQFVGDLYNAFLRRGGDLEGVAFWVGEAKSGRRTRDRLRRDFLASPEFSGRISAIIAKGCFDPARASLLEGSFTFLGAFPQPGTVTYRRLDGMEITSDEAYPGFIRLSVAPSTSFATVASAVQGAGGSVVAAIPGVGSYLARMAAGGESAFLAALAANGWLRYGFAVRGVMTNGMRMVAFDWDGAGKEVLCGLKHATFVRAIMDRRRASPAAELYDAEGYRSTLLAAVLAAFMEEAAAAGDRMVINMSLSSRDGGRSVDTGGSPSTCLTPRCWAARDGQLAFLEEMFSTMDAYAKRVPPGVADNTIVTLIAGNAGVSLDGELADLKQRYPEAARRIRIVGGTRSDGKSIDTRFNHLASNSSNIVYARSHDVAIGTATCNGTSFAGPEVASVLDYIWSRRPDATSFQVIEALENALIARGSMILPQDGNGFTTQAFLDEVVARIPAMCTAFTYSAWGACQPSGTQVRTILSSSPPGCVGGNPVLTQPCDYVPPACTYTYSAWSACQPDGTQTRTVLSSSPAGCTGTPVTTQACSFTRPAYCINEWRWVNPPGGYNKDAWYGSNSPGQYPYPGNSACNVYPYTGCVITYTYGCGSSSMPTACGNICGT